MSQKAFEVIFILKVVAHLEHMQIQTRIIILEAGIGHVLEPVAYANGREQLVS